MELLKRYKKIFYTISSVSKGYVPLTFIIKVLTLINTYVLLYVNKLVINELSSVILTGNNNISPIVIKLLIYIAIELFSILLFNIFQYYLGKIKLKYDDYMHINLIKNFSKLDMSYYDDPNSYNLTKQAAKYTSSILSNYNSLLDLVFGIVSLLTALFIALHFSFIIAILSILLTIPTLLIRRKINNDRHKMEKTLINDQRFTDYLSAIFLNKNIEMEMQLYNYHQYIFDKLENNQSQIRKFRTNFSLKNAKKEMCLTVINKLIYLVQQTLLVATIVLKNLTIGDYSYYNGIISNLSSAVNTIINQSSNIAINDIKYQEYLDIINRCPHISTEGTYQLDNDDNFCIKFENVSFKYPNSKEYTLKNISFSLKKGEKLALVGKNGSGKSTLVKLMLRFYDPSEGRIFLNDIDIREYELTSYRRLFSAMFQDLVLYLLPIRDNIAISDIDKIYDFSTDENIQKILKDLGFDLENDLELDLDKHYGKEFYSDGYILSKGQQQRIHAARTLFHEANMFVLDEPAASLDAISEAKFLKTLEKYSVGKTILYITHRYNNLDTMDNIILLDAGSIVESGTQEDLLELSGMYSKLYNMQNKKSEQQIYEKNCVGKAKK